MILTRLTGMNAADSVKSLTAAVNSFSKAGVTSTQVINKMAKVDAAFAVSSEDLAKSIARVGSSAVDAGVSLDQFACYNNCGAAKNCPRWRCYR